MRLRPGQSVAVRVALDGRPQWVLGAYVGYDHGRGLHVARELVADERRQVYEVADGCLLAFPQRGRRALRPSDRVHALWRDEALGGYTTIFYPATVTEVLEAAAHPGQQVLKVKYDGDPRYTYLHASWAIQPPYCERE